MILQRINRALEVILFNGKSLTELTEQKGEELPYQFYNSRLHQKIVRYYINVSNNVSIK